MSDIFIILKAAISVDGYLGAEPRLLISGPEDLAEVEKIRSSVDAILIGAGTLRADNPRLLLKTSAKQPMRVVLSRKGEFDPKLNLLCDNKAKTVVYHTNPNLKTSSETVKYICLGEGDLDYHAVIKDLASQNVKRLLVEGGVDILSRFYALGMFDQLRLSVGSQYHGKIGKRLMLSSSTELRLLQSQVLGENVVSIYQKN